MNTYSDDQKKCLDAAINQKKTKGRIDVIDLAVNNNIKVFSTTDIKTTSFIAYDEELKTYEIYVNAKDCRERQRFSIAHELAHYILHRNKIHKFGIVGRQNACSLSAKEEREADNMAAEILMPQDCVREYLINNNISDNSKISDSFLRKIAKEFEVSIYVAAIKLRDMGYYVRFI